MPRERTLTKATFERSTVDTEVVYTLGSAVTNYATRPMMKLARLSPVYLTAKLK